MIDDLIQQLQDSDAEVRGKAILALGRSKDPAALRPLAQIVRGDPDPALRELARKAGQYIRQQNSNPPSETPVERPSQPRRPIHLLAELEARQQETEGRQEEPEAAPEPTSNKLVPVKGREYKVSPRDVTRAREYTDAALSLNIGGDNAKAMKSLTEGLSLNPNLINDAFFTNVAAAVTGLDNDAAVQMIIDRDQRKQFTSAAEQAKKDRRVEQHLSEAKQSSWGDVWWELGIYSLVIIIGPILATLVSAEMAKQFIASIPPKSADISAQIQTASTSLASISFLSLLPVGIVSGLIGVGSLLFQTVLIHYLSKSLGGTGTWRHLIQVLLSFYNKWFPILFFIGYITIAVAFVSYFSPIVLCLVIALVILSLYVSGQTSSKIGVAYDFGAAKGCMALIGSFLVVFVLNAVLGFVLAQVFGANLNRFL